MLRVLLGHPHPAGSMEREGLKGTAHHVSTLCCVLFNAFPALSRVLAHRCLTDTLSLSDRGRDLLVSLAIKPG